METSLRAFLWISIVAHLAGGAVILGHARTETLAVPAPSRDATSSDTVDAPETEGWMAARTASSPPSRLPDWPLPDWLPALGDRGRRERGAGARPRGAFGASGEGARAESAGPGTARFGAVGDRAAVDLATAFTRGFPQAASADPAWSRAPFGGAGDAIVTLQIDGDGALVGAFVDGSPGPALRAGIARTIALLRARTFTSNARMTRLRVIAKVEPDDVHDGLHGEVFAIGGSFEATQGSAFFALAIGRRIDLLVHVAR